MAQTTPTPITAVPTPAPQRNDRTTFSARVDGFVTWLINAVTEFNTIATNVYNNAVDAYTSALASANSANTATTQANLATAQANAAAVSATTAINAPGTNATSSTSLTVATTSQSLTIQTGKLFVAGQWVTIASTVSPTTQQMTGPISSYNSGTGALVVDVKTSTGISTLSSWNIALAPAGIPTSITSISLFLHNNFGGF